MALAAILENTEKKIQTACRRSFSGFYKSYVASCTKLCFCPHLHIIYACLINIRFYMHFYGKGLILLSELTDKKRIIIFLYIYDQNYPKKYWY